MEYPGTATRLLGETGTAVGKMLFRVIGRLLPVVTCGKDIVYWFVQQ